MSGGLRDHRVSVCDLAVPRHALKPFHFLSVPVIQQFSQHHRIRL